MIRSSFHFKLDKLNNEIIKIGDIVKNQIELSIESLVNRDLELATSVIKKDEFVNKFQRKIEDMCIKLIAAEQPLARDLRLIFTASKIVTDLERMADHAVDIARIGIQIRKEEPIKPLEHILKMDEIVKDMLEESLKAYVKRDAEKCYEISKRDDEIDIMYSYILKEMLPLMKKDKNNINQAMQLLFVCKYLERLGDHITNICEWTIYLVTGEQKDLNN